MFTDAVKKPTEVAKLIADLQRESRTVEPTMRCGAAPSPVPYLRDRLVWRTPDLGKGFRLRASVEPLFW
jgi:hypothetical protein